MSIQTKEVPAALGALLKAKGQNLYKDTATVQSAATTVEKQHTEVPATSDTDSKVEPKVTPTTETKTETKGEEKSTEITPKSAPEPTDSRNYEQAWKELKQHYDKTVYELREENKQLKDSLSTATRPVIKPPKTPEEMKAFKEQYGEAVDYIRTIVMEELSNDVTSNELKSKIEQVTTAQNELKEKEAFKKLLEVHPDADAIRRDPKFAEWFNEQPEDIKRILATSTDYRAISKQLSLYKLEVLGINPKEKKKAETNERVDASLAVDIKGHTEIAPQKKIWTGSEIKEISSDYKKWYKLKDELDAARRENRVDWSK